MGVISMAAGRMLAVLLFCGLAACQSTTPSSTAPVTYTGQLPEPSPLKIQRLKLGGDYVHRPTGFVFPDHLDGLERVEINIATENEDDVSGNYKIPGRKDFLATALVFPIWNVIERPISVADVPAACEEGYRNARETAFQRLTKARVVKEEAIAMPRFKDAVFTRVVVFEAAGGAGLSELPLRSELYWQCGIGKVWVVMHRISYLPDLPDSDRLTRAVVDGAPKRP
jgi:hypothetical protein